MNIFGFFGKKNEIKKRDMVNMLDNTKLAVMFLKEKPTEIKHVDNSMKGQSKLIFTER